MIDIGGTGVHSSDAGARRGSRGARQSENEESPGTAAANVPARMSQAGHALIVEENMIVGHAIKDRLAKIGFRSFDTAWTGRQALELAHQRFPDLIVVGDSIEDGSAIDAARTIAGWGEVTVILATADSLRARRQLPTDASLHGPIRIDKLDTSMLRHFA